MPKMKNHLTKAKRAEFRESSVKVVKRIKKEDGRTAVLGAQHILLLLKILPCLSIIAIA